MSFGAGETLLWSAWEECGHKGHQQALQMALSAELLGEAKAGRFLALWDCQMSEFPRPDLLFFHLHIPNGWKVRMVMCDCTVGPSGWRSCTYSVCLQKPSD